MAGTQPLKRFNRCDSSWYAMPAETDGQTLLDGAIILPSSVWCKTDMAPRSCLCESRHCGQTAKCRLSSMRRPLSSKSLPTHNAKSICACLQFISMLFRTGSRVILAVPFDPQFLKSASCLGKSPANGRFLAVGNCSDFRSGKVL